MLSWLWLLLLFLFVVVVVAGVVVVGVVAVVVFVVIVFVVVVSFWTRRKTEREMEENIWRRKINGDANQPTDQPAE